MRSCKVFHIGLYLVCLLTTCRANVGDTFEHFFLREFTPEAKSIENVFEDDPFYALSTIPSHFFLAPHNKQFFEDNSKDVSFPYINIHKKYYFDTKARSDKKIMVLLFGTLWDPDIMKLLRVLAELHETYSMQSLNQQTLERQLRKWFKKSMNVGYEFSEVMERTDGRLRIKQGLELQDLQNLEMSDRGARLFMPDNVFLLFNQLLDIYREITFQSDVIFAFVAVSANDADANEILKEEEILFSFLNDSAGIWTNRFVKIKVPAMLIVDHEDKIAYQGEVLDYVDIKMIIDRLMINVFKYIGGVVEERFSKIRRQKHDEKLEKLAKEKRHSEEQ